MSELPKYGGALLRYRIMAFTTGTVLVAAVFIALPLQWWAGAKVFPAIIWTGHGFLFIIYLVVTLELGVRMRWDPVRMVLTMAAGTIPFLSFVAERNVHRLVVAQTAQAGQAGQSTRAVA